MSREASNDKPRSGSFFAGCLKKLFAFMFSVFTSCGIGQNVISNDGQYRNSAYRRFLGKSKKTTAHVSDKINIFFSKSRVSEFFKRFTLSVMSMSVKVYAIFFTVYGITSALIYYALMFIDLGKDYDTGSLITSALIVVLSIPFLASSRSLTEISSTSLFFGGIVRSFLLVPEESLATKKRIGSTAHMFIFATLGFGAGLMTYFMHPIIAVIAFFALILFLVVMSFPESGVMMIAVVVPFLQYAQRLRILLPILVSVTCLSYLFKVLSGKRVGRDSSSGILIGFFCGFILVASTLSAGGWKTFAEGLYYAVLIAGGFYITYNLMKSEQKLRTCTRCLAISFGILIFMGIWDILYEGGAADVLKSSLNEAGNLISSRIFYIADSSTNFGIIACFMCPIVFCEAFSKKSVSGVTLSLVCFVITLAATLLYGTYESFVAIAVGLLAYMILHDRKSFTAVVLTTIVVLICFMLIWSFVPSFITDRTVDIAGNFVPVTSVESYIRDELTLDTWKMIKDGNLAGIGAGESAFVSAFKPYSSVVTENARSAPNLYLQIICIAGFGGLAVFILFFLTVFKNAVGYMLISTDKKIRKRVLAITCSLGSALLLGTVINIWSDVRMMYLYWMMTGLLCGYVKLGREREEEKRMSYTYEADRVDISVRFQD